MSNNKITIIYDGRADSDTGDPGRLLEEDGWNVFKYDLGESGIVQGFWRKLSDGFWYRLTTSTLIGNLSEKFVRIIRRNFARPHMAALLAHLRRAQPPLILTSSHKAALIVSELKSRGMYLGKLAVLLSGYNLNPLWSIKEVDMFLCGSERQGQLFKQLQVSSAKYLIIRPTLKPSFFEKTPTEAAASHLGLLVTMPTVLLIAPEGNPAVLRESFFRLIRSNASFQVAVVCSDPELKLTLENITSPVRHPVKIYNDFENLDWLMSAASVIVGPIGQKNLSQAAAKRLPIVLTDTERLNYQHDLRYLMEQGTVTLGRIPAEVVFLVESALSGRKLTNSNAAFEILALPKGSILLSEALAAIKPGGAVQAGITSRKS
jgi:hypothetical protein